MKQPKPVPNNNPELWAQVIEDMHGRDRIGKDRYATPLQIENGRDFGQDLYEELLDAVVYCKGLLQEHAKRVQGLLKLIGQQQTRIKELETALADAPYSVRVGLQLPDATCTNSVCNDVEPPDVPGGIKYS